MENLFILLWKFRKRTFNRCVRKGLLSTEDFKEVFLYRKPSSIKRGNRNL